MQKQITMLKGVWCCICKVLLHMHENIWVSKSFKIPESWLSSFVKTLIWLVCSSVSHLK